MPALCFFMAGHGRLKGRNQKIRLEPTTGAGGRTREGGDLTPGRRGLLLWFFGAIRER